MRMHSPQGALVTFNVGGPAEVVQDGINGKVLALEYFADSLASGFE